MRIFIPIAVALLVIAIGLLISQLFNITSADNRIYRADKEFYKFAGARPFTNDIYIRKLRKYELVDTKKYYEEFDYTGKYAINGSKQFKHFSTEKRHPLIKNKKSNSTNIIQKV